jgi:hypothetical protein
LQVEVEEILPPHGTSSFMFRIWAVSKSLTIAVDTTLQR